MKRRHSDEDDTSNKKQRKNVEGDIFDDESLNNCFCNVDKLTSAIGCFTGVVDMFWANVPKKLMLALGTRCYVTGNSTHKVLVTFEGDWVDLLQAKLGQIGVTDKIQLCLDGVTSVKAASGKTNAKLVYKDGVILRRARGTDSRFVNSWRIKEEQKAQENLEGQKEQKAQGIFEDWFTTPVVPISGRLSEIVRRMPPGHPDTTAPVQEKGTATTIVQSNGDAQTACNQRKDGLGATEQTTSSEQDPAIQPSSVGRGSITVTELNPNATTQQLVPFIPPAAQELQQLPISNKQKKKRKKKAKKQMVEQVAAAAEGPDVHSVAGSSGVVNLPQPPAPTSNVTKNQVVRLSQIGIEKFSEDTPQGWMAQLQRSEVRYTTMKEVSKPNARVNLIGIVKSSRTPSTTRTGDWTTTIHLQDPSLCEDAASYTHSDFSVVFFQKRFMEWLPQATCDDILILHDIRLQNYDGTISGIGYHDRAKWGVYSISQQCMVKPTRNSAPEDEELVDGGLRFSPFLQPTEPELRYCLRLSDWWKERSKAFAESAGQVYHLGDDIFGSSLRRTQRQHRLFCDAGPHVEPGGYFDCTFEVLNGFQNENGVHTIYVTDYTANPEVAVCQAQWCPPGLNDRVVRFELWDEAAKKGPDFVPGSYWTVRNARMRRANDGYAEGKIVQPKFGRLDADNDFPALKLLLERKKEWEKVNEEKRNEFQHKLFKDATDEEYINCTVELLHTSKGDHNDTYIYVTDYTAHPKLSSYSFGKEWSRDLEGKVVAIHLRNAQVPHAGSLRKGYYLLIKSLHLKHSNIKDRFQGDLGGPELLIHRLNINSPNNDFEAFLRRKAEWENGKERMQETHERKAKLTSPALHCSTIKELNASIKPELKARLIARVVDYYPYTPTRWVRLWCSQCRQRIPEDKRACHRCQDTDHEFVQYKFELMLRVEDLEGDHMEILVRDGCYFQDLELDKFAQHFTEFPELTKRLSPLLGDIHNFQEWADSNKKKDLDRNDFAQLIVGRNRDFDSCWILLATAK